MRVCSPVTGSVHSILVEENQTVKKGKLLIVVESMKVLLDIVSPTEGTVRRVLVREGEIVSEMDALVEIL